MQDERVRRHDEQQYTLRDQAVCAEVSVLLAACEKSDLSKEMLPGEASLCLQRSRGVADPN
jgi:hypothetical protein